MPRTEDWFNEPDLDPTNEPWDFPLERQRKRKRAAVSATFVTLFFAGAAFTAGAGNLVANNLQGSDPCAQQANAPTAADPQACDAAAGDGATTDAAPPSDGGAPADPAPTDPASPAPGADASTSAPAAAPDNGDDPQASSVGSTGWQQPASPASPSAAAPGRTNGSKAPKAREAHAATAKLKRWIAPKALRPAPAPEVEGPGLQTVWINSALPDPTPPAKRLTNSFAFRLAADAKKSGVDWALVLGALRAGGDRRSAPATNGELQKLSQRLASLGAGHDEWAAALALDGHADFADQAVALAHYDRAVGLWALVHGLDAAKHQLTEKILNDSAISIYAGGRSDLDAGRVDVRVIALIAYLRETFGSVTVSCLVTGHRLYARPGVISAHIYGRAVDIAAVGGTSILGNQQPGGITEKAVRAILLLPSELQPRQVISLLGLGGPSFPLADHYDHVHVGY